MKLHSDSLQQKLEDKDKEIKKINDLLTILKTDHKRENKLLNEIINQKEIEIQNQKKMYKIQSKELLDLERNMPVPNTAKSHIERRKNSNKSKLDASSYFK